MRVMFLDQGSISLLTLAATVFIGLLNCAILYGTYSVYRRLVGIEAQRDARQKELEKQAKINVEFLVVERHGLPIPYLKIGNSGLAPARNVIVRIDGKNISEYGHINPPIDCIKSILPGNSIAFMFFEDREQKQVFEITVNWEDDSGSHQVETIFSTI